MACILSIVNLFSSLLKEKKHLSNIQSHICAQRSALYTYVNLLSLLVKLGRIIITMIEFESQGMIVIIVLLFIAHCSLQRARSNRIAIGRLGRCFTAATAEAGVAEESSKPESSAKQPRRQRRRRSSKPAHGPDRTIKLEDLDKETTYEGHVVGLTDFGAFVNIGAMTDGLLHISQISRDFVSNVADVVSVGDVIEVRLINVDLEKQKFSVTALDQKTFETRQARREEMAAAAAEGRQAPPRQARASSGKQRRQSHPACPFAVNQMVQATVKSVVPYGVFVNLDQDFDAMLHTSHMSLPDGVTDHMGHFQEGQELELRVIHVGGRGNERIRVSQLTEAEAEQLEQVMTRGFSSSK